MTRMGIFAIFGPSLFLVAPMPLESVAGRVAVAGEQTDSGLMAVRPRQPRMYSASGGYGLVTAVDTKSITLRWCRCPEMPPVKLAACEVLAAGGIVADYAMRPPYPLADVRVGDQVYVLCGPEAGVETCYEIWIYRRPGGRLGPPSVMTSNGKRIKYDYCFSFDRRQTYPYHEWINAFQDYEERGIPLPEKMRPDQPRPVPGGCYLLQDGTLTKPHQVWNNKQGKWTDVSELEGQPGKP